MSNTEKTYPVRSIGRLKTQHLTIENMPIQPSGAANMKGIAELYPEYAEGLTDLEGFSHIILLYYFHQNKGYKLKVKPFMDNKEHGIFATRSPRRPAGIGMSIVKVLKVTGTSIEFEGADMLNSTPLLDIKPFFRQSDNRPDAISGWLDEKDDDLVISTRSDDRFKNE